MADANVSIAGLLFPRWFHEFVRHAMRGDFTLVVCPYLLDEVTRRIARGTPRQRTALAAFLDACELELVDDPAPDVVRAHLTLVRDPADVPIALAAISARVDYLVSNDKDLTAQDETTARLRERVRPVTVGRFLHEVMGWSSEDLERIRRRTWEDMA